MEKKDISGFLVISAVVVLGTTIILFDIPMLASAQEEEGNKEMEMNSNKSGEEGEMTDGDAISRVSEYIGILALGISLGLLISPSVIIRRIATTTSDLMTRKGSTVFVSIAALTISAGIIHVLLIKEHMEESYMWGISFLVMGISQLIYGAVFIVLAKKLERLTKRRAAMLLLCGIGIIGNILLVALFILARLFVPPFSPEGTPVDELEANGIVTVIVELFIIGLLIYLARGNSKTKKVMIENQRKNMK